MKDLGFFTKIYLAVEATDFRKQIKSLSVLAETVFKKPMNCERTLFVFRNKKRDAIRILYWDQTGFAMWCKILETEKFSWPKSKIDKKIFLSSKELKLLLQGVDLSKIKYHEEVKFSKIS
jgi:transposase